MEIDVNSRWDNDLDSVIVVSGFLGSELESIVPESYSAGLSGSLQDGRQFIRGEEPGWSILISVWLVEVIQPHSPKAVGPDIDISREAGYVFPDRVANLNWKVGKAGKG